MNDLAVLVADKNTEAALTALLARPQALGIRPGDPRFLTSKAIFPHNSGL